MKKYLFGLGAMLVGAGLMFVLMHGEVEAENTRFTCTDAEKIIVTTLPISAAAICTGHGLKCVFAMRTAANYPSGVSCVKTGMFK